MRKSMSSLISNMITTARSCTASTKLAACLLRGCSKPIGDIHTNHNRNYFHGKVCSSAHAEGSAIISHYGENLSYTDKAGWVVRRKASY